MEFDNRQSIIPSIPKGLYDRDQSLCARADGSINPNVWNKVYKVEHWKDIRFPVGHVYEDVTIAYQILDRCKKLYVLDDVLYIRRIRPESITSTPSSKNRYDYVLALAQFESYIEHNLCDVFTDKHLKRIRGLKFYQMITCYNLSAREEFEQRSVVLKDLRKEIINLKVQVVFEDLPYRIRIAYYIILCCPWLLRMANSVYHRIRIFQRKVIGAFGK